MAYKRDCAAPAARVFVSTLFFRLSPASLFLMQTNRPPFSFSSCRKRKRLPAAKRKRTLSMDWTKVPFNRAFWPPHLPAGHNLKVYLPFRSLGRLPWRFLEFGGVTVCSTSYGRTLKRLRHMVSTNLGGSKGAAHGPLCRFK